MNKELEALEEIKRQVGNIHYFDFTQNMPTMTTIPLVDTPLFKIVENALKNYEQIETICESYGIEFNMVNIKEALFTLAQLKGEKGNNWENYNKKLKAFEIIKNKRLNADEIYHKDYEWYLLDHKNDDKELIPTKEEYDLVKEELL